MVGDVPDYPYLRFPHLSQNLVTFVAEDDVWLAPLDEALSDETSGGARAWRLTADHIPPISPRLNPSGTHVAWSSTREGAREAYAVQVDGGPIKRLTYWGTNSYDIAGVRGWVSDTEVLVTSVHERHLGIAVVAVRGVARRFGAGAALWPHVGRVGLARRRRAGGFLDLPRAGQVEAVRRRHRRQDLVLAGRRRVRTDPRRCR